MAPGGPLSAVAEDPTIKAVDKENLIKAYGLDKPLPVQYWDWVSGMMRGDFGTSFVKSESVSKLFVDRLPNTLVLTITSFIVSILIATPLGIICALRPNSRLDQFLSGISFVGLAVPGFWLAIMLMMLFAVRLGWLPSGGLQNIGAPFSLADRIKHMIMPVFSLAVVEAAVWFRYIRASMLDVVNQDYMRTANAKGLGSVRILLVHGIRNAMIPLATIFGLSAIPGFFTGALVIESIFSIPGMGSLATSAAFQRDYPVLFATTTLFAVLTVLGNFIADIMYAVLDPRVDISKSEVKV